MFLGRSSVDFLKMARCGDSSGTVWLHQPIWRLLPCGVGISETITRRWAYPSRTVYWTRMHFFMGKTLTWDRRWIDWLGHGSYLYDLNVLGWDLWIDWIYQKRAPAELDHCESIKLLRGKS